MKKVSTNKNDSMNEYFFVHSGKEINQGPGYTYTKGGDFSYLNWCTNQIKIKHKDDFIKLIYFGIAQKHSIN